MKLSKTQVITAAITLIEKEYIAYVNDQRQLKESALQRAENSLTKSSEFKGLEKLFGKGERDYVAIWDNYKHTRRIGAQEIEPSQVHFTGEIRYKFSKDSVHVELKKAINEKAEHKTMSVLGVALGTTHWQRLLKERMQEEIRRAEVDALINSKEFRINLQAFMESIGVKIKLPQIATDAA